MNGRRCQAHPQRYKQWHKSYPPEGLLDLCRTNSASPSAVYCAWPNNTPSPHVKTTKNGTLPKGSPSISIVVEFPSSNTASTSLLHFAANKSTAVIVLGQAPLQKKQAPKSTHCQVAHSCFFHQHFRPQPLRTNTTHVPVLRTTDARILLLKQLAQLEFIPYARPEIVCRLADTATFSFALPSQPCESNNEDIQRYNLPKGFFLSNLKQRVAQRVGQKGDDNSDPCQSLEEACIKTIGKDSLCIRQNIPALPMAPKPKRPRT